MLQLYPIVFVSGILTVLSPCVLPILPIVLGAGIDGKKSRVYGTITGLVLSFTFFALTLTIIIQNLGISADTLRISASYILGFFGITLVFPRIWETIQARLETVFHPPSTNPKSGGFWGGFLTGSVLGLVWTPCIGPIIATVTTLAALEAVSFGLAVLMFTYALGIGTTLLLIAHGGTKFATSLGWYKSHQLQVRRIFGIIVILTALAIGTGLERRFQSWVLDHLPNAIANPVSVFESFVGIDTDTIK